MSDMKQSFFTKVLNPIKDNKYFNAKDAMFVGITAAGAAAGYGLSDGDFEQTVNGGIFGVTGGVLARYGTKGYTQGLKKFARMKGELGPNMSIDNMFLRSNNPGTIMNSMKQKGMFTDGWKGTSTMIGGSLAIGAATGALGGAIGELTGAGTTATGGAIEGGALMAMGTSLMSLVGNRGGGLVRLSASGVSGAVLGIGAAIAGGYEGLTAEDGGIQKALIKGAVYGKLGKTAAMLGTERYGSSFITKKATNIGGK